MALDDVVFASKLLHVITPPFFFLVVMPEMSPPCQKLLPLLCFNNFQAIIACFVCAEGLFLEIKWNVIWTLSTCEVKSDKAILEEGRILWNNISACLGSQHVLCNSNTLTHCIHSQNANTTDSWRQHPWHLNRFIFLGPELKEHTLIYLWYTAWNSLRAFIPILNFSYLKYPSLGSSSA